MSRLHRKPYLSAVTLLLALAVLAGPAGARDKADEDGPRRELVMFIAYADVPPYSLDTPHEGGMGILPDVLKAVLDPLGYTFTTRKLPDRRGWDMLQSGGVDVYATSRAWVERPDRFLWTDSFMLNEDVLLYRAESTLKYTQPADLYGQTVAGIKGFVYPTLEEHFGPGKIHRLDATAPEAMLELLTLGRADAVIINRTEILWMFHNRDDLDADRFRIDETHLDQTWYRFVFPADPEWEHLIEQINIRLKEMKRDGTLDTVLARYR